MPARHPVRHPRRPRPPASGQASVEFVALLPLVVLVGAVLLQGALAGWAVWSAGGAARAAARAHALGRPVLPAARAAVPAGLRDALVVRREGSAVRVLVRVPALVPWAAPGRVGARARFTPQDGAGA